MKTILNIRTKARKVKFGLFIVLLTIGSIKAQVPPIEWEKSLGGSMDDVPFSIKQTTDGGYIVGGSTNSNDGDVTGNNGSSDTWVVKLAPNGDLEWQNALGSGGPDSAKSIFQTSDGGYIAAGHAYENGGDVTGNHGIYDFWITKLSSGGALEWQKSLGGSQRDLCESIIATNDGGYVLVGESSSEDGDVTGHHGDGDIWVVKINSIGIIQWQKTYGGSNIDVGNQIISTSDGNYLVAGYSRSIDGDVGVNHGEYDYWVIKIDSNGLLLWEKSFGGSADEYAFDVRETSDGGYVVGGYTFSNDGNVSGNNGLNDCWLIKLDVSGNLVWQRALGGSLGDTMYGIELTPNGNYAIIGASKSNNGDVSGNHGLFDYWAALIDNNGVVQWQRSLGGSGNDSGYAIGITLDGGYCLAGSSEFNDGDVSENNGMDDYWVVKLASDPLLVAEFEVNKHKLYPNPVANMLQIDGNENIDEIEVFDMLGHRLLSHTPNSLKTEINMESYSEGIYIIQITANHQSDTFKIVKQ